ncbi:MAG TPA: glycosyltransferase family 2 protein [Candidatus Nanoarchaeia archaeon]|nr:glycosyltransferase family 2 protein [Candidatus Nanoarchaeia archaeon]
MKQKIWAVIAAYNEAGRIGRVLEGTRKFVDNVVVVDDGSKDSTFEAAKKNAIVLRHSVNLGKGAALKTGCDFAIKHGADIIVVLDADGQHDPREIPRFLKALKNADIVFGYRKLNKRMPLVLRFGNWFINTVAEVIYGMKMKDTQSGYRAFRADVYKRIRWEATDYSMESEMIANVGKNKLRYREIPIETIYGDRYKGTTIIDGIKIVFNMVWWKIAK